MSERQKALSVKGVSGFGGLIGCFGMVFGFVFSSMFFGMGSLFLWMIALQPALKIWDAATWVETPCTITKSEVEGDESYKVVVEYDYEISGKQHSGNQYNFFSMSTGGRTSKERIAAQYKEGTQHACFVNPSEPTESVIDRSFSSSMWWGLFPIPFILVGLVGYWFVFFGRSKLNLAERAAKMQQEAMTGSQSGKTFSPLSANRVASLLELSNSDYDEEDLFEEPGPVTLEPDASRFGIAIVLFVFATFWNGIVSIFVFQRLGDWLQFQFSGFEDLFLVPFILIGIGVFLAAIYNLMASFNPRPTLILSRQLIPLGSSAQIQWSFEQGTGSIRQLKLVLSGIEEATYRRGTNTYTDSETFHEEILFETTDSLEIREGQVSVMIPSETMHSFQGGNNKIEWTLQLKGDIPLWPDIDTKFPIRVVPHE